MIPIPSAVNDLEEEKGSCCFHTLFPSHALHRWNKVSESNWARELWPGLGALVVVAQHLDLAMCPWYTAAANQDIYWTSRQDGAIDRYTLPPHTTKRR